MPVLHLLAGPNGAGKSQYAKDVLVPVTRLPFVNADVIAATRWPDPADAAVHAYDAATLAEAARREKMSAGESFITETVFSHPSKVTLLADAISLGYLIHLHIIMVPVDVSVQRVRERVTRGGHTVPEDKIRARHQRLWDHVAAAITIADISEVFDNTSASNPFRQVAVYNRGTLTTSDWPTWTPDALPTNPASP